MFQVLESHIGLDDPHGTQRARIDDDSALDLRLAILAMAAAAHGDLDAVPIRKTDHPSNIVY